jgi:hypothetical protein
MWTLAAIVSGAILVRIFSGWHAYDVLARIDAGAFVFLLLAFPTSLALSFRNGKQMDIELVVVFAYVALMMSTVLASH